MPGMALSPGQGKMRGLGQFGPKWSLDLVIYCSLSPIGVPVYHPVRQSWKDSQETAGPLADCTEEQWKHTALLWVSTTRDASRSFVVPAYQILTVGAPGRWQDKNKHEIKASGLIFAFKNDTTAAAVF